MNTTITWLIEKNVFADGNPERVATAARALGDVAQMVEYVDSNSLPQVDDGNLVITYGSIGFVRDLVQTNRWQPTAWFDEQVISCHRYYQRWTKYVLQQNYRILTLGEVCQQLDSLYKEIGEQDRLFIRPDDNVKSFAGSVVEKSRFEHWHRQNTRCYDLKPSLLCVVARPQQILREWRVIICQRRVLTASAYIGESRSSDVAAVPTQVLTLAGQIAAESFDPLPIYAMDIAETDAGLFLMEIGSVNCSSLYACDVAKIVNAMHELASIR